MTHTAELFWSFRSPYSYLATRRYVELTEKYDLEITLSPVYPLAIRQPDFFERNHSNWLGYTVRDIMRVGEFLNIPITAPNPDPIVQNIMTREIAEEQPYVFRLTRLGQAAKRAGRSLAFADEVSQLIWGGVANWHEGDHLTDAAQRAGLDLVTLDREAVVDSEALDAEITENQARLEAGGHWGVPTLVYNDEPFFGQDRIEIALWRMQQNGLEER